MAFDKVIDSAVLDANLTSVANAIRTKGGTTETLSFPDGFVSAVEGIQAGGGGFPELIYETTFENETTYTNGASTLCTITTGYEGGAELGASGEIIIYCCDLESYAESHTPSDSDIVRTMQTWWADSYDTYSGNSVCAIFTKAGTRGFDTSGRGIYHPGRPNALKTLTLNYRVPGNIVPAGTYRLKLYRVGMKNAESIFV